VSTEKLNGVTVYVLCGASSFPVRTCGPFASGTLAVMQTFAKPSEAKVPIEAPSMKI
jgi:hypothetical protein